MLKCRKIRLKNLFLIAGIPFTHLASAMPARYRKHATQPRGVSNRRAALQWIRDNVQKGVLYFGDDDNTYDLRLFEEIRHTQHISMFPVGLIGDYAVSAPVVREVIRTCSKTLTIIVMFLYFGFGREELWDFTILGRQVVDLLLTWPVLLLTLNYYMNIPMQL